MNEELPLVFADFNNFDTAVRLRLTCRGTEDDLHRLDLTLEEGMKLLLSDGELWAIGIVTYSKRERIWVASVDDWGELTDLTVENERLRASIRALQASLGLTTTTDTSEEPEG